ncbi:radical SAM domain protein [Thermosulfidibacter takaii ABI70S6]|uniref:Radical SAM domain protein n=1 Tax=Thermosulfidibacter takaii (strain DSM 17441 / JCM 13301 / NBRC 103674 / ABI70S6) TaxID=1298851 RepID=A0A0S3QR92_THET7|nr:TIGR03936 family radical SAM-associated protein [Thermosulfidibacter takaii]BAT70835.1 radical SAM domain protein [Thermosulfidibacter takaii ABI70S6]
MNLAYEVLKNFQKPGRYINHEINAAKKDWKSCKLRVLLAYPDAYDIGMSSYGYQLLYSSINKAPEILCDRAFLPWKDLTQYMISNKIPLWGLETSRKALEFDLLAFSLHYELCYTNVLWFLKLSQIPLFSIDRTEKDPIVVAGGPCCLNPLPLKPFIDAFFIGEWEVEIKEVLKKLSSTRSRQERLSILAEHPNIYVPSLNKGAKRLIQPLSEYPDPPLVTLVDVPHNRITIEIARGCGRGCRFCHAGFVYRPVREREPDEIIRILEKSEKLTGYEEVSLLSLSTTDYSKIEDLIVYLGNIAEQNMLSIALPSFRAGTLTPKIIEAIKKVKKTGFTIAPEAGSQRLRDVINKNLSEKEILDTVEKAALAGWQTLKLYFMIGLPTEKEEDVEAIGNLIYQILKISKKLPRRPKVNVTISPFVPKPHTPFQWEPQEPLESLATKIEYLKKRFIKSRAKIKNHNPYQSLVEAYLSRGDEKSWQVVYEAFKSGAMFDEWGEEFKFELWEKAMEKHGIDPFSPSPSIPIEKSLPWEIIDVGINKNFLLKEREKAYHRQTTSFCHPGCKACGSCNAKTSVSLAKEKPTTKVTLPEFRREKTHRYLCYLQKLPPAHLIGQNDLESILHRAFRRAGIPLAYSQGFSPHPAIAFPEATSLGIEIVYTPFELGTWKEAKWQDILKVNQFLPAGIRIVSVEKMSNQCPSIGKLKRSSKYLAFVSEKPNSEATVIDRTPNQWIVLTEKNPLKNFDNVKRCIKRSRLYLEG